MAKRPVFIPISDYPYVKEVPLEFEWHPGFSITQSQKSIDSLHQAARKSGIEPVLEISTKSDSILGKELSAFNLFIRIKGQTPISLECAFQGSKIFENGGPYTDLYQKSSREAKKDERLRTSGNLIGFNLFGEEFPIQPLTVFYDWLYINALSQNKEFADQILKYSGFTDIAFNPQKSINCQARSAALYVALGKTEKLDQIISDKSFYLSLFTHKNKINHQNQIRLPFEQDL